MIPPSGAEFQFEGDNYKLVLSALSNNLSGLDPFLVLFILIFSDSIK